MRPPAPPREPLQAQSHPSGSSPTPGAAPEASRPVSPPQNASPQTGRKTDQQPTLQPQQQVKIDQHEDAVAAQLKRERERTREQDLHINDLQQQLDDMKSIILRMKQPPSPSSSSDSEHDDGSGYTDDESNSSSNPSRPQSPIYAW
ncbi:hypothetical protein AB1Y20_006637 [Prymnesium parvum]|uniref:Uncharacterized protein n=1 Tax=Prymnesium parvum TaxID=97485 RepID=A0AB34IYN2_PRYPA